MEDPSVPTTRVSLWDESVEVLCFGAATGDWKLNGMTAEENETFNPGIVARMQALIGRHGANRLYLPSPSRFNGLVADATLLGVAWTDLPIYRGAFVEGVTLGKIGEACGIASSDCPTIIARNRRSLLTLSAHAGRESLYDLSELYSGTRVKTHRSVVDAIVEALAPDGRTEDVWAHVTCGIGPAVFRHRTDDPVHGERNRRLLADWSARWGAHCVKDGDIDLAAVIAAQFRARGVPNERLSYNHECTFEAMSLKEGYRWHSHRRERDGKRNLVLAIRRK